MKIILDSCVWGGAKAELLAAGHDAIWTGDFPEDPGDIDILKLALAEDRVLITLDKDFGDLAIRDGFPHGGIIRLVNIPARRQSTTAEIVLKNYASELSAGAILTVEATRIRVRLPVPKSP